MADNGIGVPPDSREKAFTLLRQVHEHGAAPGGSGIGITDGIDGGAAVWFRLSRCR